MIGKLTGILLEKNPPQILVDCNGVGYEVDVPMTTFYNLPATGERVSLLTHFVVREDAQILYGFQTAAERSTFRLLIKISGVGPRTALGVLSGMGVDELARADGALVISTVLESRIVREVQGIATYDIANARVNEIADALHEASVSGEPDRARAVPA